MTTPVTRPTLLSRVRDTADHDAWNEFDARYRDLILRYARRRGLQASDAEDVRQMVMLNLARQLRTFQYSRERGQFRHYLGRTIKNAIARYYRSPRPRGRGLDSSVASDLVEDPSDERDREWEIEWMHHHYRLAMHTVRKTADEKSVRIFEHLLDGLTPDEVAARLSMTRDAVHKVKQRMRDRLKLLVAAQIADEEEAGGAH